MKHTSKKNHTILEWDGHEPESVKNSIPAWRPGSIFSISPSIIDSMLPPAHKKQRGLKFVVTEIIHHQTDADKHKIKAVILDKDKLPTKEYIEFNYKSGLSSDATYHGNISM